MFIDISTPLAVITALAITICILLLAKEVKKSALLAILLGVFIALLVIHTVQFITLPDISTDLYTKISRCLTVDFIFVFISYISYLWVDDIETKYKNKKSIDNSLEWFWKKV